MATQKMDYMDATTNNILSPDILPVKELKGMLRHFESQLPLIIHLPKSLDKTPFLQISKNSCAISRKFLLVIDVPIQDRAKQLQIYGIFNLPVPHGDISARYKINNKYKGITFYETQAIVMTEQQYSTCLHANGQFSKVDAPF